MKKKLRVDGLGHIDWKQSASLPMFLYLEPPLSSGSGSRFLEGYSCSSSQQWLPSLQPTSFSLRKIW